MMKVIQKLSGTAALTGALLLCTAAGPTYGMEMDAPGVRLVPAASVSSSLSMMRFFGTPIDSLRVGNFPGKLVSVPCDLVPAPGAMKQCAETGERQALSMDDGSMVHPLLAGTQDVLAELDSAKLHGKAVSVHGKYYPSTGAILKEDTTHYPPPPPRWLSRTRNDRP